jgi:hypothetical protein
MYPSVDDYLELAKIAKDLNKNTWLMAYKKLFGVMTK